jgi:hypothetical protein
VLSVEGKRQVNTYTITVVPDGGDDALITIRVDASAPDARITELAVRAADGTFLAPEDMSAVNLDLLLRAVPTRPSSPGLPAPSDAMSPLRTPPATGRPGKPPGPRNRRP